MPSPLAHDPAVPAGPSAAVRLTTPPKGAVGSPPPRTCREFGDRHVVNWTVYELDCAETPGARAPRCLVFDTETKFRRVYDYPREWRALSDAELVVVSWRR